MEETNIDGGYPPKNYLTESILVTLFCCLPLGIVGIINAAKVQDLWRQGDKIGAQMAADEAKKWCKYSLIAAVVVVVLYFLFIGGMLGIAASNGAFENR